jgi:Txe/YoeB family toxin of Txe-Axe toxin-antitoxin module
MNEDLKNALDDLFLGKMSMENIVDEYGVEIAQELGEIMNETHEYLTRNINRIIKTTTTENEWYGYSEYFTQMKSGMHGSFSRSLSEAWLNADNSNRIKLVEAFPNIFPQNKYKFY